MQVGMDVKVTKHTVLRTQAIDHLQLMVVHPSGDSEQQEPEWIHRFGPLSPRPLSAGKFGTFIRFRFPDNTGSNLHDIELGRVSM